MSSPTLLAFDTATEIVHLALTCGEDVFTQAVEGGAKASVTLLPALQSLVSQAGLTMASLDAIAVGRGPGAFTGLRTACAVAQGLALGLEIPVLMLDTLMAVAESARLQGAIAERVWVMQDARMGEVYAAAYDWTEGVGGNAQGIRRGAWRTAEGPRLYDPLALASLLLAQPPQPQPQPQPHVHLAGNALTVHASAWAPLPQLECERWPQAVPAGAALASLALAGWARGEAADPALALPLYVRDKVAQTTAERLAQRAMAG